MKPHKFDGIIACGDSFTWYNQNTFEETWPYILGQHYGVPVVNLGRGGASNFEIAFQPLQSDEYQFNETFMGEFTPKNPLVIFGITTKFRIPMIFPKEGKMGSISSILPEDFGGPETIDTYGVNNTAFLPMALSMLALDRYDIADYNAIKTMARLQTLMPHATVVWGSIHSQQVVPVLENDELDKDDIGFSHDVNRMKDYYQRLNNEGIENICFNEAMNWLPLESVNYNPDKQATLRTCWTPGGDYFINRDNEPGVTDMHPNAEGIQRIASQMIRCIDYRFSQN